MSAEVPDPSHDHGLEPTPLDLELADLDAEATYRSREKEAARLAERYASHAAAYRSGEIRRNFLSSDSRPPGFFRRIITRVIGAESADTHLTDIRMAKHYEKKAQKHTADYDEAHVLAEAMHVINDFHRLS